MDHRTSYVARRRVHIEPDHLSVEPGDTLMHDPVAGRLTIFRDGNLIRTVPMTLLGMAGMTTAKIFEPISSQTPQKRVLTGMPAQVLSERSNMRIETIPSSEVPDSIRYSTMAKAMLYDDIAEALLACNPDQWLKIPLDMFGRYTGRQENHIKSLQGKLIAAMQSRNVEKIRTGRDGEYLFMTVVPGKKQTS